ncbi:transmembrane protein 209 [Ostrinia nubilalis]|uniref:transmembrane protein 209 n=1 Tax=Ostrinia nubilalis TaxID=29057 RepID=UPI0030824C05
MAAEALSLSLSMSAGRAWRSSPPPSPPSPHTPHSAGAPSSPASPLGRHERDEFIADRRSLADYLRSRADRGRAEGAEPGWGAPGPAAAASPVYQLAAVETDGGSPEERAEAGAGPAAWRRLQLDPQRLTQFNLNLRVWLHATVLVRVARELDALDAAFAAHGLSDVRMGQVSTERLRKLAGAFPALAPLLPFLEPFPDQRYVVQRYRELAAGGCLSAYKWNGGGAGWDEARPADAELLLHALAAYLDAQLPREASGAGGFSARHVSAAPAPPPRGPRALALHRAARAPPHFVLVHGEETVEVGAGRNNLLHCLLVFVALCGAREPPALRRLHLGPAGLNLLWVIGR